MKNGFSLANILIVLLIIVGCCFFIKKQSINPFDSNREIKSQEQAIHDKIDEIQKIKDLNKEIENNLKKEN